MTCTLRLMNKSDPPIFTHSARRGRSRKSNDKSGDRGRSYWLGEVFVDQGWAWSTQLVEAKPVEGERRCWQAIPLCLGREDDIVPILKGERPIPDDMHPRRRFTLQQILEVNGHGRVEGALGATRVLRGGHARTLRNRQTHLRRLKTRAGLALRKTHH